MRSLKNHSRQRGFSLVEVMVATAILVIVLVGILTLYDRANRVFKTGNEAAELQQNVRIAYERMVGDIRMAGFDYKRGGPLLTGQNAAPWGPGKPYSAGTIVTPTTANGRTYRATNAGTSGPTEPSWPTGTSALVVENGATPPITWQENGGAVYEQRDEQIEFAGTTALTVRGNYNYSVNPNATDHGRESNLESTQFPVVTTGNAEIVTYALVSNVAPSGTAPNNQTITFFADTNVPRNAYPGGSRENQVDITGVDLTNANPPYTLYRFTIDNAQNIVRTPLADNIRSMNFFYYEDPSGQKPLTDATGAFAPNIGGAGRYDPTVANSENAPERLVRRKIRSIRVRLIGMNSQPDVNLQETSVDNGQLSTMDTAGFPVIASDTNPAVTANGQPMTSYRKVTDDTLITPRNLGMTGLPQVYLNPPPAPTLTNICIGYCGIAVVNWNPNTSNPNASYIVAWDTSATGTFSNAFDAGTSNTYAVDLTGQDLSQTYYFQVRATNAGGSVFSTNTLSGSVANATKPGPPSGVVASGGVGGPAISGRVRVSWIAPQGTPASGSPSCTPAGSPSVQSYLSEIQGFRVFRSTTANFNASGTVAGAGNCVIDENTSGPTAPTTDGYGNYSWDDTNVTCGQTYYYRVQAIEWCAANAAFNTSGNVLDSVSNVQPPNTSNGAQGISGSTGIPRVPLNLEVAPLAPTPPQTGLTNSVCTAAMNVCSPINLRWVKVTQDTTGANLAIDSYDIERTAYELGVPVVGGVVVQTLNNALQMSGSYVTFADTAPMHDPVTFVNYTYKYRVRATQPNPCPSGGYTLPIDFPPPCTFSGSVIVETGATLGDGLTPASAWIMNAGDTIQVQPPLGVTLATTSMTVVDPSGAPVATYVSNTSPANFTWLDLVPGTPYSVTYTITDTAFPPCTEQLVRYITQQPTPVCSLTTLDLQPSILANTATIYQLKLSLKNVGPEALTLRALDFNWTEPNRITWNTVQFPSGATAPGPGTSGGAFSVNLFPTPGSCVGSGGCTAGDLTVPASGTSTLLINMAKTNGNPANITPSVINSICVEYQTPTQGLTASDFRFHCRIAPSAGPGNPNACN